MLVLHHYSVLVLRLTFACTDTGGAGFIASHVVRLLHNKYPHYKVPATQSWVELVANKSVVTCPGLSRQMRQNSLVLADYCAGQAGLLLFKKESCRVYGQESQGVSHRTIALSHRHASLGQEHRSIAVLQLEAMPSALSTECSCALSCGPPQRNLSIIEICLPWSSL